MTSIRTYKIPIKRQILRSERCIKKSAAETKEFIKTKNAYVKKSKKHKKSVNKQRWYKFRRKINKYIRVARNIAEYAITKHGKKLLTSKDVKHLGKIPSTIANQIIRKYQRNLACEKVTNVNLIIPACAKQGEYASVVYKDRVLTIKPIDLQLKWICPVGYLKIHQVEVNNEFCYITISVPDEKKVPIEDYPNMIGVDVNVKHNLATVGNNKTRSSKFLGKGHIYKRSKYVAMRARYQRQGRLSRIKQMGNKEQRVMRELNHQISHQILEYALNENAHIALERLTGILSAPAYGTFKKFKHTWAFYQLKLFIQYKGKKEGLDVFVINPAYTSQNCSNCGNCRKQTGKLYICRKCKLRIHRDENASYNIAIKGTIEQQQQPNLHIVGDATGVDAHTGPQVNPIIEESSDLSAYEEPQVDQIVEIPSDSSLHM